VASSRTATELRRTLAELTHERQRTAERVEVKIEREMHFNPDRSPRPFDGRALQERRREAERIVRQREAAR
jgi:hypothetical protein